jgi:hypothetical protein
VGVSWIVLQVSERNKSSKRRRRSREPRRPDRRVVDEPILTLDFMPAQPPHLTLPSAAKQPFGCIGIARADNRISKVAPAESMARYRQQPAAFYSKVGFINPPRLRWSASSLGAVVPLTRGRNAVHIARPSYDRLQDRVLSVAPPYPAATENIEDASGPHIQFHEGLASASS